jgi:hypothetical protein
MQVWGRLHEAVLHRLDDAGLIDVTRVVLDTAHVRVKKGANTNGLPLLVGISSANTHDSEGLKPMIEGHQTRHDPYRGRHSSLSACTRTTPPSSLVV